MHDFATETESLIVHILVKYWCIVRYGIGALWGLCNRSIDSLNICFWLANLKW